jgi:hypothetical protein
MYHSVNVVSVSVSLFDIGKRRYGSEQTRSAPSTAGRTGVESTRTGR